ncbi:MAG: hypothetical protein BWY52_03025 [Chloroflexi bacterium ADurb.Bin325]|nr:MAG: hypothetical protein BWY52_03025 [Chloroflexi bacterium ADurb.Bin325]
MPAVGDQGTEFIGGTPHRHEPTFVGDGAVEPQPVQLVLFPIVADLGHDDLDLVRLLCLGEDRAERGGIGVRQTAARHVGSVVREPAHVRRVVQRGAAHGRGALDGDRFLELYRPGHLAGLLLDDRPLRRERGVEVVDEADRHPGHEGEADVFEILVERVVEQPPALQQPRGRLVRGRRLVRDEAIADAPDGAGRDIADHQLGRAGQPDRHRALRLLGQARLQEVDEICRAALVLDRHAHHIGQPQRPHRALLRQPEREERGGHRLALRGQIDAHDDAAQRAVGRRQADAPPAQVAQQVAQAGVVGELDRGAREQRGLVLRRLIVDAQHLAARGDDGQALEDIVHLLRAEGQRDGVVPGRPLAYEIPHAVFVERHLTYRQTCHDSPP